MRTTIAIVTSPYYTYGSARHVERTYIDTSGHLSSRLSRTPASVRASKASALQKRPRLKNVLAIDDDVSLLPQFLVFGMQELLKTCPRLLPLPVHELLAILSLVCHIRRHVSRLAFRHLEHKM